VLILAAVITEAIIAPTVGAGDAKGLSSSAEFVNKYCATSTSTAIPPGSDDLARRYYADLSTMIGLDIHDPKGGQDPATSLDDVVRYLGYAPSGTAAPLTAKEIQDDSIGALMDPVALGQRLGGIPLAAGDVLAARFFAPKISDLSGPVVVNAGWRKLVRLRALPGSPATRNDIAFGVVLFNFFAPIGSLDPFAGADSVNTQTILVGSDTHQTLYWLDFGKMIEGSRLGHELDAFFDAGHIPKDVAASGGAAPYFVPCACAACHGALQLDLRQTPPAPELHFDQALLDFLDTDHWEERVSPTDDFDRLRAPILADPGTFAVVQQLNAEILRQNTAAQPQSMLRRAAEHWVAWHLVHGDAREHLFDRSLKNPSGDAVWNPSDPVDAELLPHLNRYCYRCHGTVLFDVLDKQMILDERPMLVAVLRPRSPSGDPRVPMPPDRTLSEQELKHLSDLVLQLK
jgi:hypothetical protein